MFDLNKIIDIIKEGGREVFLAQENKEPVVIMSIDRYRKIIEKDNLLNNNLSNNINSSADLGLTEEDYPDCVKKTIMSE